MTYSCCKNSSIANLDHNIPDGHDFHTKIRVTNRVCIKCFEHWYGRGDEVKQYSKQEWDAWVNSAFNEAAA